MVNYWIAHVTHNTTNKSINLRLGFFNNSTQFFTVYLINFNTNSGAIGQSKNL